MNHIRAKKSLGQNFLKSKGVVNKIIEEVDPMPTDAIIEIGPGKGALTEQLLIAHWVIAIEKDDRLAKELAEKFKAQVEEGRLVVINSDVLEIDFDLLIEGQYKIVGNIPYNITGLILRKIFKAKNLPTDVVLMLQKEVAQRIVARDKKESILSMSIKIYGDPKYVQTVKNGNFSPKPKVDSAILRIDNISRDRFKNISEEKFFEILKKGFAHKRKKLSGNLGKKLKNLDDNLRAEEISLNQWLEIAKEF